MSTHDAVALPRHDTSIATIARLGWAGAVAMVGLLITAIGASALLIPAVTTGHLGRAWTWGVVAAGLATLGVSAWLLRRALQSTPPSDGLPEPERSCRLYGRHLVGIGFALLGDALTNVVVVGALIWSAVQMRGVRASGAAAGLGPEDLVGDSFNAAALDGIGQGAGSIEAADAFGRLFGRTQAESLFILLLLVLSTLVAVLGALFFFANSMWTKMGSPEREPFDRSAFWAGLWFRLGEAVLFNLVFFLVLRLYAPDQYLLLPLVSLLVGMFLKSGEQMIAGLATRLFAALTELLPIERRVKVDKKLYQFKPSRLPRDKDQLERAAESIRAALLELPGVERVQVDRVAGVVRVRYDPEKTSAEEIRASVQLLGFDHDPNADAERPDG